MIARSRKEGQQTGQVGRLLTVTFVLSHRASMLYRFLCFFHLLIRVDMYVWLYATISTHRNNMSQSSQSPQHQHRLESSAKGHRRRRWEFSKLRSAQLLPPNTAHWVQSNRAREMWDSFRASLLYAFLFSVLFCVELFLVSVWRERFYTENPPMVMSNKRI